MLGNRVLMVSGELDERRAAARSEMRLHQAVVAAWPLVFALRSCFPLRRGEEPDD